MRQGVVKLQATNRGMQRRAVISEGDFARLTELKRDELVSVSRIYFSVQLLLAFRKRHATPALRMGRLQGRLI